MLGQELLHVEKKFEICCLRCRRNCARVGSPRSKVLELETPSLADPSQKSRFVRRVASRELLCSFASPSASITGAGTRAGTYTTPSALHPTGCHFNSTLFDPVRRETYRKLYFERVREALNFSFVETIACGVVQNFAHELFSTELPVQA